jgi:hypothetical protein
MLRGGKLIFHLFSPSLRIAPHQERHESAAPMKRLKRGDNKFSFLKFVRQMD